MPDFLAGFADVDITPPLTIPYLGFIPRQAYFTGVHDPLCARALALEADGQGAIVIVADAIGFDDRLLGEDRHFTSEVRTRVAARTGLAPESVMLACTHAHSTPETLNFRCLRDHPGAAAWLETLLDQLASAAAMAWEQRTPRELRWSRRELAGFSNPRRAPVRARHLGLSEEQVRAEYALDRDLRVLVLSDPATGGQIVVAHFAAHPVTVQVQPLVSADFPGAALGIVQREVARCEGALFLQGCDGDVNPTQANAGFDAVARHGLLLGGGILQGVGEALGGEASAEPATLRTASTTVMLPSRPLPSLAEVEAAFAEVEQRFAAATSEADRNRLAGERRMVEEQLVRVRWGEGPVAAEVQALRLGDVAVIGLPGEPFAALGHAIQEQSPAALTLVCGYANGYLGYLAPPEAWAEGGYEVMLGPWSHAGPEACGLLAAAAGGLLQQLWG